MNYNRYVCLFLHNLCFLDLKNYSERSAELACLCALGGSYGNREAGSGNYKV